MIEELLPSAARVSEARGDGGSEPLFAVEARLVARAVDKRRREFATGRTCARRALAAIGLPATAVPSGDRGQPLWPPGVVGSITHCQGYRACAVAHATELAAIGVDAEPHAPLPAGLIGDIALEPELAGLASLASSAPDVHWGRLLFCAKEAVYKAWYPLAEKPLDFGEALVRFESSGWFSARLLVPGPTVNGRRVDCFRGRWAARDGLALAAVAVRA